ncbi:THUMP-like domain-containing protein [Salinimicrobium sediminilitoris]|uniref:THUMP-like domain-containing protein n=1 Tax=Salinimicrobium sediminilitoris TaxID=2876715 RepID=UPI001E5C663C|nr:class I SAM-dependent methyltransferase [Salinimicrobium sediminilitoris]MCC8358711.1 class I SAM-dependent methyltransferase [Salinimicrobium sediminilitoris]
MNRKLLNNEVQEFLENNYKTEVSKMAFQGSPFEGISTQELLVQLSGKKRAEKKLPLWFQTREIIYPPNVNLEQTSSEITAKYKASLIEGDRLLDLTGGFGIDSYYFANKVKTVRHFELNPELQEIASHNFQILNARNVISEAGDGIGFLKKTTEKFDWIYIDPSRRDEAGGRVFFLSECLPNVPEHIKLLQEKANNILVKTSPLLDLQAGLNELENVHEIHVVAVENDVKELLWILKKNASEVIRVKTVNFQKKGEQIYESSFGQNLPENYQDPEEFLYEPNAAIMKSGLFAALGKDLGLNKLHPNTQLFTSEKPVEFPGRRFKILQVLPFRKKQLKKKLQLKKANISTRNFPETVADLRKQLQLKEGGDSYLFFTTLKNEEKVVLVCQKS